MFLLFWTIINKCDWQRHETSVSFQCPASLQRRFFLFLPSMNLKPAKHSYSASAEYSKLAGAVYEPLTIVGGGLHTIAVPQTYNVNIIFWLLGRKGKCIYIAHFCSTSYSRRSGMDHTVLPVYQCLPQPRKRSPVDASPDWGCGHLIAAYFTFIYPEKMKGWVGLVGWLTADRLLT